MNHPVQVAEDICRILMAATDYIVQTRLTKDGVLVKVGNTANKQAGIVNVSDHWKESNNWLQNKLLAVRLAYRLNKYLKTK